MQSYPFPLPHPHGRCVGWLLQCCRRLGLLEAAEQRPLSRRHRLMRMADERRARARKGEGGALPPAVAAVAQPTYFGSFCATAIASPDGYGQFGRREGLAPRRATREEKIDALLCVARRQLALEREHQRHVRDSRLDDADAARSIVARERQIAVLCRLRAAVPGRAGRP